MCAPEHISLVISVPLNRYHGTGIFGNISVSDIPVAMFPRVNYMLPHDKSKKVALSQDRTYIMAGRDSLMFRVTL